MTFNYKVPQNNCFPCHKLPWKGGGGRRGPGRGLVTEGALFQKVKGEAEGGGVAFESLFEKGLNFRGNSVETT